MNVYDVIVVAIIALTWLCSVKMVCNAIVASAGVKGLEAETLKRMFEEGRKHGL